MGKENNSLIEDKEDINNVKAIKETKVVINETRVAISETRVTISVTRAVINAMRVAIKDKEVTIDKVAGSVDLNKIISLSRDLIINNQRLKTPRQLRLQLLLS